MNFTRIELILPSLDTVGLLTLVLGSCNSGRTVTKDC